MLFRFTIVRHYRYQGLKRSDYRGLMPPADPNFAGPEPAHARDRQTESRRQPQRTHQPDRDTCCAWQLMSTAKA